jgi:uncharacterized membrane protein
VTDLFRVVRKATRALVYGFALTTAIPLVLGFFLDVPSGSILSLIGATLILQANGVFVGLGLGLDPSFVLAVMIFVELGAVLAIYEVLEAFEDAEKVKRFVKKAETAIQKYPILSRYGAVTLMILPALPIVGLYTSVPIGWIFRWNKALCIFFITLGWILVVALLMLISMGLLNIF